MSVQCTRVLVSMLTSTSGPSVGGWLAIAAAALVAGVVLGRLLPLAGPATSRAASHPAGPPAITGADIGADVGPLHPAPGFSHVAIPDDVSAEILDLSRAAGRPVDEVVREAVRRHREELVDAGLIRA